MNLPFLVSSLTKLVTAAAMAVSFAPAVVKSHAGGGQIAAGLQERT
jgi:hypothetical protein